MADVDDRGQLLLVGALTLAVMLVALAVLLNAAIYTGNVATRDAGPEAGEVIEYENEATAMARAAVDELDVGDSATYDEIEANFTHTVDVWSRTTRIHSATSLSDARVETNDTQRGTQIAQSTDRNFTNASGGSNWTVANDSHARAFRLNVTQDSLAAYPDTPVENGSFRVTFDNGTDVWKVYLHQGETGNVSVTVVDAGGNKVGDGCTVDPGADDRAVLDLTGATLGDRTCPELEFFDQLSGSYDVEYVAALNETGGEQVNGTYSVVVDRPLDQLETGAVENGEPTAIRTLYSAELRVTYRTTDIYYETTVQVVPGAPDE